MENVHKTDFRTHTCGELRKKDMNKKVTLCGWANTVREHGKLIFIDLRDRYGITQIVCRDIAEAKKVALETVMQVKGQVKERKKGTENKNLTTGEIEILANEIKILTKAAKLPIQVNKNEAVDENTRLKYRFLDLRRPEMQKALDFRNKVIIAAREYFEQQEFIEVETPILVKPTPEGARDYIVPSRVNPGKFYALPQSPQLYKQILMIAGFDRYFQIARCLRDEDLRADRQPEHTQIDLEVSFVTGEDIMKIVEGMYKHIFKKVLGIELKIPFPRLTYKEAMSKYRTDKPDIRKNKKDKKEYAFCWIYDFPLFAYNKQEKKWEPEHHIFSSPKQQDIKLLDTDPGKVKGALFDIVLNGSELGSGSIRIIDPELQEKIMKIIGLSKKEANKKFGFLLDAYKYAGPPHGGMGLGLDRLIAIMLGYSDIREVIAFPRNKAAQNPMDDSPSEISKQQLDEAHISLKGKK